MNEMQKLNLVPYQNVKPLRQTCFKLNQIVFDCCGSTATFNNIFGKIHERLITEPYIFSDIYDFKHVFCNMSNNPGYQKAFHQFCKNKQNIVKYYDNVNEARNILLKHCTMSKPFYDCIEQVYKCYPDMIGYSKIHSYSLIEIKVVRSLNFDSLKTQLMFYDLCYGGLFKTILLYDAYNGVFYQLKYPYKKEQFLKQYGKMIGKGFKKHKLLF